MQQQKFKINKATYTACDEKEERGKEEATRHKVKEERKVKSHKSLPSLHLLLTKPLKTL